MADKHKYIATTGRHKEAVAQIRLEKGSGTFTLNGQLLDKAPFYITAPLKQVGLLEKINLSIIVKGGGVVGQKKSVQLGVAQALAKFDETSRTTLKRLGYLKRDSRVKERKKYGLKKARRAPQWAKR